MGRKYRHLFERIIDPNNLKRAYGNAARGKTNSHGYLVFREHFEARIATLHRQLADGTWQSQPYRNFTVYEPKQRSISAPTFSDRVVHHAVVQVIEPIFDATFLPYSFACRNGKGTHAGVKWGAVPASLRHLHPILENRFQVVLPQRGPGRAPRPVRPEDLLRTHPGPTGPHHPGHWAGHPHRRPH